MSKRTIEVFASIEFRPAGYPATKAPARRSRNQKGTVPFPEGGPLLRDLRGEKVLVERTVRKGAVNQRAFLGADFSTHENDVGDAETDSD
jgi:hypothetical protein